MTLSRRRLLSISAACLVASPAMATTHRWQGRALGGDVEITLLAPDEIAVPALRHARALIAKVEQQFSLFDPASAVTALNTDGRLDQPDPMFIRLMRATQQIHDATGGLFDPTVQPLWRAYANGTDIAAARDLVGWEKLRFGKDQIVLGAGQALTFNGIAQGFATDLVSDALMENGLEQALVNIGEFRANGGAWRLALNDPQFRRLGTRSLKRGAIATSSPSAMALAGADHILHPIARPLWSTVSIEADDATTADGFSTALCLAPLSDIRGIVGKFGIRRITLVDKNGDLTTV